MNPLLWIAVGVGLLYVVKYLLFGLHAWNQIFHPMRAEDPSSLFLKPLLGLA